MNSLAVIRSATPFEIIAFRCHGAGGLFCRGRCCTQSCKHVGRDGFGGHGLRSDNVSCQASWSNRAVETPLVADMLSRIEAADPSWRLPRSPRHRARLATQNWLPKERQEMGEGEMAERSQIERSAAACAQSPPARSRPVILRRAEEAPLVQPGGDARPQLHRPTRSAGRGMSSRRRREGPAKGRVRNPKGAFPWKLS